MPSSRAEHSPNEYWRSLGQLADAPSWRRFAEAEFPAPGDEGRLFGPIVWIALQIPVVLFSLRAQRGRAEATPPARTAPTD